MPSLLFSLFNAATTHCFVTDLNLNLVDLSMTCKNCVGSSVDLSSIFSAKDWTTLTKCSLNAETISFLSVTLRSYREFMLSKFFILGTSQY